MLSEFIRSRLSYPAMPLAGQQVHQRSVQLGPLVASFPCYQECRLYLHPFRIYPNEDGGVLPMQTVIFYEMIRLYTSLLFDLSQITSRYGVNPNLVNSSSLVLFFLVT